MKVNKTREENKRKKIPAQSQPHTWMRPFFTPIKRKKRLRAFFSYFSKRSKPEWKVKRKNQILSLSMMESGREIKAPQKSCITQTVSSFDCNRSLHWSIDWLICFDWLVPCFRSGRALSPLIDWFALLWLIGPMLPLPSSGRTLSLDSTAKKRNFTPPPPSFDECIFKPQKHKHAIHQRKIHQKEIHRHRKPVLILSFSILSKDAHQYTGNRAGMSIFWQFFSFTFRFFEWIFKFSTFSQCTNSRPPHYPHKNTTSRFFSPSSDGQLHSVLKRGTPFYTGTPELVSFSPWKKLEKLPDTGQISREQYTNAAANSPSESRHVHGLKFSPLVLHCIVYQEFKCKMCANDVARSSLESGGTLAQENRASLRGLFITMKEKCPEVKSTPLSPPKATPILPSIHWQTDRLVLCWLISFFRAIFPRFPVVGLGGGWTRSVRLTAHSGSSGNECRKEKAAQPRPRTTVQPRGDGPFCSMLDPRNQTAKGARLLNRKCGGRSRCTKIRVQFHGVLKTPPTKIFRKDSVKNRETSLGRGEKLHPAFPGRLIDRDWWRGGEEPIPLRWFIPALISNHHL